MSRAIKREESLRAMESAGLRRDESAWQSMGSGTGVGSGDVWGDWGSQPSSQATSTGTLMRSAATTNTTAITARRSSRLASNEFDFFAAPPSPSLSQLMLGSVADAASDALLTVPAAKSVDAFSSPPMSIGAVLALEATSLESAEPTMELARQPTIVLAPIGVPSAADDASAVAVAAAIAAAAAETSPRRKTEKKRKTTDDVPEPAVATTTLASVSPASKRAKKPTAAAAAAAAAERKAVTRRVFSDDDDDDADDDDADADDGGDDDGDGDSDEFVDAPSKAKKKTTKKGGVSKAPAKKKAARPKREATAASSPRRGRPTRLEQDEDPDRARLKHELSLGTLQAPLDVSKETAQTELLAIQAAVVAREKAIGAFAARLPSEKALGELANEIAAQLRALRRVCCGALFDLPQLALFMNLEQKLLNQQIKSSVLTKAKRDGEAAGLVFVKQPQPSIPFKDRPGQVGEFLVQVFAVPPLPADKGGAVGAVKVHSASRCKDWDSSAAQATAVQPSADGAAAFLDVVMTQSSRMEYVTLTFASTVRKASVATPESHAMIVVTNESQWPGAAKKLLWLESFVDEEAIPWPFFANHLQSHVVVMLYGRYDKLKRSLQSWELQFIHNNARWFNGAGLARRDAALEFWAFFGHVLTALRFKRHIITMWELGELIGLISKEQSVALLTGRAVGTFCLRFSESVPGSFAVSYVTSDARDPIKHFLVKPTDLGHNRTLPDFLQDKAEFEHMLVLVSPPVSLAKTKVLPKHAVLRDYYKVKEVALQGVDGYVNV
jgi:hypothetical protein